MGSLKIHSRSHLDALHCNNCLDKRLVVLNRHLWRLCISIRIPPSLSLSGQNRKLFFECCTTVHSTVQHHNSSIIFQKEHFLNIGSYIKLARGSRARRRKYEKSTFFCKCQSVISVQSIKQTCQKSRFNTTRSSIREQWWLVA